MSNETPMAIAGYVTADPELRYSAKGTAVVAFRIASTPRTYSKTENKYVDKETLFLKCKAFNEFAENIAESFKKGDRVVATGNLDSNSWENKEGQRITTWELNLVDIGASVRNAHVSIQKNSRKEQFNAQNNRKEYESISTEPPF